MSYNLDFKSAIKHLNEGSPAGNAGFMIANQARPATDRLFATLLPERLEPTYDINETSMRFIDVMAGMTSMDGVHPPAGYAEISSFQSNSVKLSLSSQFTEASQRKLQLLMQKLTGQAHQNPKRMMQEEVVSFYQKILVQGVLDRGEWLRARALIDGEIDWTFNNSRLKVDYGIPAENKLDERVGPEAYGGADSKFWNDIYQAIDLLGGDYQAIIAGPKTIRAIEQNEANSLEVTVRSQTAVAFSRFKTVKGVPVTSRDPMDSMTMVKYAKRASFFDPAQPDLKPKEVPFMDEGKVLVIGRGSSGGYVPGQASTPQPETGPTLGYYHVGPTVEGDGAMGRWGRLFVPERAPHTFEAEIVENGLPVLEHPDKIVVLSTEI